MVSKNFAQYDKQWGSLGYPKSPDTMSSSGCGVCACADLIVNNEKYKDITPKEVRKFMIDNGYAIAGAGTAWNGITACMKNYGFNVINHASMETVWTELKSGAKGIFLFRGGSVDGKTVFTTGGHYISVVNYKYENNKHWVYLYDSGQRKHTGWYCYETQIRGLLPQVWTVSLPHENAKPKVTTSQSSKHMTPTNWKKVQTWLGVSATGRLAGQSKAYVDKLSDLHDILKTVDGSGKSDTVKAMQCWLGVKQTGIINVSLIKKLQAKIKVTQTGVWDKNTSKALISYIGKNNKPNIKKNKDARMLRLIDALEAYGRDIEKSFKYSNQNSKSTWAQAKKNHIVNCAKYVSWALQYAGVLSSGKTVYCKNGVLKGSGASQLKTSKHTRFSSPKKTVGQLVKEGKLKRGDVVMLKSHTMVVYSVDKKTGKITWYSAGGLDVKAKKVRNVFRKGYADKVVYYLIRVTD